MFSCSWICQSASECRSPNYLSFGRRSHRWTFFRGCTPRPRRFGAGGIDSSAADARRPPAPSNPHAGFGPGARDSLDVGLGDRPRNRPARRCPLPRIDVGGRSSSVILEARPIEDAFAQLKRPLRLPATGSAGGPLTPTTGSAQFMGASAEMARSLIWPVGVRSISRSVTGAATSGSSRTPG